MRDIDEKLLEAVKNRGLDKVIELINLGANPNVVDEFGRTPLHWASRKGDTEIVSYLLKVAPNTAKVKDNDGWTPLHHASWIGYIKIVSLLLKVAPDTTKVKDNNGKTPLHWASWEGYTKIVSLLLKVAPDTAKERDIYGQTPLHYAFWNGYTEVVSLLLEVAPDIVNVKNNNKEAPIYQAKESDASESNKKETIQTLFASISIKLKTKTLSPENLKIYKKYKNKKQQKRKYIF